MIGEIISAGSSLIGGMLNRKSAAETNRLALENAQKNRQMQTEFAQHGIRWKVEDAKKAGIHPLYALGAQTNSYAPVTVGLTTDTSMGSAVASAGQDIGRAINATRTTGERVQATEATKLQLEGLAIDNEIKRASLASQLQRLAQNQNPPFPGELPEGKLDPVTPLVAGNTKLTQNKGWSDGSTFEDRWGEWGGSMAGLAVMAADLLKHAAANTRVERAPFTWLPKFERR